MFASTPVSVLGYGGIKKDLSKVSIFRERYFSKKGVCLIARNDFILARILWEIQVLMVSIFDSVSVLLWFPFFSCELETFSSK